MSARRRRPAWGKLAGIALLLVAAAASWRYTPLRDYITAERMVAWADAVRATPWAPFAIVAAYTPAAVVMFPRPLLTLVAVVAYGPLLGAAYAGAGIMLAALATYVAGRYIPYARLQRLAGDRLDAVKAVLKRHAILAIFALNQTPAPPFVVQGLIAGACRLRVWEYAAGSFLGMAPTLVAWVFFGGQLAAALREGSGFNAWAVAALVAVLVVFTLLVRRWFVKQEAAGN